MGKRQIGQRDRAEVHEVALSDASGRGTLYVPLSDQGVLLHLAGSLSKKLVDRLSTRAQVRKPEMSDRDCTAWLGM